MNTDTQIFVLRTDDECEILDFLQHFGRDLVTWTHTAVHNGYGYKHFVTARVGENYGDFEGDMYVPFN